MGSRKTVIKTIRDKTVIRTSRNPELNRPSSSRMPMPMGQSTPMTMNTVRPSGLTQPSSVDPQFRLRVPSQAYQESAGQSRLPMARPDSRSRLIPPNSRLTTSRIPSIGRDSRSLQNPPAIPVPSISNRSRFIPVASTTSQTTTTRSQGNIPSGHYVIPAKRGANVQGGRRAVLSSPPDLRQRLENKPPISIQTATNLAQPGSYRPAASFLRHPAYEDTISGNVYVSQREPPQYGPFDRDQSYFQPADTSIMNYHLDSSQHDGYMSDEELELPPPRPSSPTRASSGARGPDRSFEYSLSLPVKKSSLEDVVEGALERSASEHPNKSRRVQGNRSRITSPPMVIGPQGPVMATQQVNVSHTVSRLPDAEIINRSMSQIDTDSSGQAFEKEFNVQQIDPGGLNVSRRGDLTAPLKEVVSVTSSITMAPGISTRTDTTVVQKFNTPEPLTPADVLQMINEENQDIEMMKDVAPLDVKGSFTESLELRKRIQKAKLFPESVKRLEEAVNYQPPVEKTPEDLHPEVMASLMYSEEQRMLMEEEPLNVCNFLFPPGKDNLVVEVSAAGQPPSKYEVVPGDIPAELHTSGVTPEMKTVAGATWQSQAEHPTGDIYTARMLQQKSPAKTAPRITRYNPMEKYPIFLDDEEMPFETSDVGQPAESSLRGYQDTSLPTEEDHDLEYELTPQPPSHVSRVQLRGSEKPPWFPGYVVALPHNLKIAKSVSEVLPSAWQAVQPDIFEEDSILLMG